MNKNTLSRAIPAIALGIFSIFLIFSSSISHLITYLIEAGYQYKNLYPLLVMPFIGLFVAICRIMIGINLSSVYLPSLLIISSFYIEPLIVFSIFITVLIISYLIKTISNKLHIHFAVKVSLINSIISLLIFPILLILEFSFKSLSNREIIVYTFLIIALIGEKFLTFKITKSSIFTEFMQVIKNLIFSLVCFFILGGKLGNFQFTYLKELIFVFPEITVICIICILLIGRYSGLRLSEVFRFRKLLFKSK